MCIIVPLLLYLTVYNCASVTVENYASVTVLNCASDCVTPQLWPRVAAIAERLWTNPSTGWREAEYRMVHHRYRMVETGVDAERLQPEWCYHNTGLCYAASVNDDEITTDVGSAPPAVAFITTIITFFVSYVIYK